MTDLLTSSTGIERKRLALHPKQGKAYRSPKRVVCCCSGIQGGKSLVGGWRLRWEVELHYPAKKYPEAAFVVCSPDYKSMVQSTRPVFDSIFRGMGQMNEMEKVFYLRDGRKIYFRTMVKNPNAVEGIQNVVFIWADEAGQYPRSAWINMQSRTAFRQGTVFLTTTPYAMNWVRKEVIKKWEGGDPDIDYFEWTSADNPAFSKEEFERQKRMLSAREFRRKYMGIHEALEGLVHDGWSEQNNVIDPITLPPETVYHAGVDWGFDHPTAIVVYAIAPDGKLYIISLFKKSGLTVSQVLDLIVAKQKQFKVALFGCGSDRPDMIAELQNRGVAAVKYFEFQPNYREIRSGDQKLSELIRTGQLRMFRGIDQYEDWDDEINTYCWEKDESGEDRQKEKARETNNDLMASARYGIVVSLHKLTMKIDIPKLPMVSELHRDYFRQRMLERKRGSHWAAG